MRTVTDDDIIYAALDLLTRPYVYRLEGTLTGRVAKRVKERNVDNQLCKSRNRPFPSLPSHWFSEQGTGLHPAIYM